ncbi:UNVERIFIED_CONTAM: hypothetical protein Sradi_6940900 [Sesamum radiatum]|uniref:Uncharacterized protein n=1 Tax=Sesamum radiatum TaxID=300843 RepID=A0AAW2JG85_SESRA
MMYFAALARRASNLENGLLGQGLEEVPIQEPLKESTSLHFLGGGGYLQLSSVKSLYSKHASQQGSPLPPTRCKRKHRDVSSNFFFRGFQSNGVATRAGAITATYSRIAIETIFWIAPNMAGDNFSVEVSEEVLCHRGSAIGTTTLGSDGTGTKGPGAEVGSALVTICKAWVFPGASTTFCLFVVLLGISIKTHVLNSVFLLTASIDACGFSTAPTSLDTGFGSGLRSKELE